MRYLSSTRILSNEKLNSNASLSLKQLISALILLLMRLSPGFPRKRQRNLTIVGARMPTTPLRIQSLRIIRIRIRIRIRPQPAKMRIQVQIATEADMDTDVDEAPTEGVMVAGVGITMAVNAAAIVAATIIGIQKAA